MGKLDIRDLMDEAQKYANKNSSDSERKVGALLCTATHNITTSNTFVNNAEGLPSTRPDKYEYMIHAEVNAIYTAAEEGVSTKGAVVLCTLSPCQNCIRAMFQAGIREVYYRDLYSMHNINMKDIKVTETPHGEYTHMKLENY